MPRRSLVPVLALVAAVAVGAAGCGADGGSASGGRLAVTASTTQLGDFARAVGGDRVRVTQLLQANSDPHDYEPRPSDITRTAGAEVVLESGDGLDRWMADVVEQSGTRARVVDAGAGRPVVLRRAEATDEGAAGTPDPHWWNDPVDAEHAVERIRDAFAAADPASAATFRANAAGYLARLRTADGRIARCIAGVPARERELVTDHDAFAYLVRRYAIRYVGAVIPSTTTQAQPSAGQVSALAATVRRLGVRAIFPESSLNPRLAEAIARQTGARVGGTLYADTLGPAGSPGATYLGALAHNADELVRGFTGGARGCPDVAAM